MPGVKVEHDPAASDLEAGTRVLRAWDPSRPEPVGSARVGPGRSGWTVEVAIDPASPSPGEAWQSLATAGLEVVGRLGGGRVQLWAPDAGAEHDELARKAGLLPERDLYQMRRRLPVEEPLTIATRPFVVGQDEPAWLAVNNRAFLGHPDQGGWTAGDLARLEREPWFDPEGFLLHERDGRLAGFCWTKVHDQDDPPLGELFVVAVDPDFQGMGLGRGLVVAGLHRLADQGLGTALLYVDAWNRPAMRLYRALGFALHGVDRAYVGVVPPPTTEPKA